MPYDINIEVKTNHIRVEVTGKRVPGQEVEDALDVWSQLAKVSKAKDIDRILYIAKMTGHLSTVAAYNISNSLESTGLERTSKLAFVDLNKDSLKENVFGETVIYNRGWANARTFDNESDAVEWLLNESK